jgi:hypothetical protein
MKLYKISTIRYASLHAFIYVLVAYLCIYQALAFCINVLPPPDVEVAIEVAGPDTCGSPLCFDGMHKHLCHSFVAPSHFFCKSFSSYVCLITGSPPLPDACRSDAFGVGLKGGQAGDTLSFIIQAVDSFGNNLTTG